MQAFFTVCLMGGNVSSESELSGEFVKLPCAIDGANVDNNIYAQNAFKLAKLLSNNLKYRRTVTLDDVPHAKLEFCEGSLDEIYFAVKPCGEIAAVFWGKPESPAFNFVGRHAEI